MDFAPELLRMNDGKLTADAEGWAKRRAELLEILDRECYGRMPQAPEKTVGTVESTEEKCCAGHAKLERIQLSFDTPAGAFSFPINFFNPTKEGLHPTIVLLNFRPDAYDRYYPAEEIVDHGYALAVIYYQDVATDDGDFSKGLAACYPRNNPAEDWGKLSMWAFGASRAVDYLLTRPEVDGKNIAVIGHSRLGKAAMICGAHDERVRFTVSNDSGCGGAAMNRTWHEGAETIAVMDRVFPFWFCGNRSKYKESVAEMPFDQHFLAACCAPRFLVIGSAEKDLWADPLSEQYTAYAASPAWRALGLRGFMGGTEPFRAGEKNLDGEVGYHKRDGVHFLSRQDWLVYMEFFARHRA